MKIADKHILITSNEPWGDIWYSKQNYAFELSRNNKVWFINPPKKWHWGNLFKITISHWSYNDDLSVVEYGNFLPVRWNITNRINNWLVSKKIRKYLSKLNVQNPLFWGFDPTRLFQPQLLTSALKIFHGVDYYYFQYFGEEQLCQNCDMIFGTSQLFLDYYSAFDKPKYVVPHGISQDEFELKREKITEINIPIQGYGLYIGVIDHRMDFEMYERVIKEFPEQTFMFVGPLRLTDNESARRIFVEKNYPNVRIEGPKHFKDLKYYIANSAFCLSFMDMNYHANTVHHHKTLVYLTQGKPIFSFVFEEYKRNADIMYLTNNKDELLLSMKRLINEGESPELRTQRIEYAEEYRFEQILDRVGDIIGAYL